MSIKGTVPNQSRHVFATLALALLPQSPATQTSLPLCVTQFLEGAKSRNAELLIPLLSPDSEVGELHTLFEVLGQSPFRYEAQSSPGSNGSRTLACVQVHSHTDSEGAEFWFWLQGQGADQRIFTVEADQRYSREWLYEFPKNGLAKSPVEGARNLFEAMQKGDEKTAERNTSDLAWRTNGGDLNNLFQTARTTGLGFVVERPIIKDKRAAVTFGFQINGQRQGEATLFMEERGGGWIATGFDDDEQHTKSFLAGESAATIWPKSPFDTFDLFADSLQARRWIRLNSVSLNDYWLDDEIQSTWRRTTRSQNKLEADPSSFRAGQERAYGRIDVNSSNGKLRESLFCLLMQTPEGWRVCGHTSDQEEAQTHVGELEETPQPK